MTDSDLPKIAAPARRALDAAGIHTLGELARHTEAEIAALHGMGTRALATLRTRWWNTGRASGTSRAATV